MALIKFEGFDHESSSGDLYAGILSTLIVLGTSQSASVAVNATTQYGTGQCLGVTASSTLNANANAFVVMPFTTASNAVIIGAAVSLSASVTNGAVLGFVNGMLGQVYVYVGGGGIKVFCGDPTLTSVQIGAANSVIASLGWAYIEMSVVINNAPSGSVNVMVNGTSVLSVTGIDTSNDNTTGVSGAMLGTINTAGTISGYTSFFDDVYVCDTTGIAPYNIFLGPVRVITQFPIANGTITSFTGLAHHANYLNVAQIMDGDATYNSSATTGSIDTFFGGTLPASTSGVFAVKVVGAGRIDDSGIRTVQTYLKSGASVTTGASNNLVGSYQYFSDMYINDPNTTVQWSASGVNLVQFGYKIVPSPGSPVAIGFASIVPAFVAAMQQVVSLAAQPSVGTVAAIGIFGQVINITVSIGTMTTVASAVQVDFAHVSPLSIGGIIVVGTATSGQLISATVSFGLSITGASLSQLGSASALITLHPVIAPPVGGFTIVQGLGISASATILPKAIGVLGQLVSASGTGLMAVQTVAGSMQSDLMSATSALSPITSIASASSANASNIHIGLSAWLVNHNYTTIGTRVASTFVGVTNAYQLVSFSSAGLSGSTPPNGTGNAFSDGQVVWKYLSHVDFSDLPTWANAIPATLTQPVIGLLWNDGPITTTTGTPFLTLGNTASPRVTSVVNTITLKPAPGEGIRDKLAGGSTALNFSSANGVSFVLPSGTGGINYFDVCDGNVIFSGLQFQDPNATSGSTIIQQENSSSAFTLTDCIIDGYGQTGGAVIIQGGTANFALTNCLIVDRQTGSTNFSIAVSVQSATTNVVNCTVLALGAAPGTFAAAFVANSAASVFRNDIIMGYPVNQAIAGGGGMICPTDHCLFDTANPGNAAIDNGGNLYSKTMANQFNSVTNDFRLKVGADALNAGATDTTNIPTSDDIAGTHRPIGLAWDIGVWE